MEALIEPREHLFYAVAFVENLPLREISAAFPEARTTATELHYSVGPDSNVFIYPFGAVVFHNVAPARRETELARVRHARPGLTAEVVREDFLVREQPDARIGLSDSLLTIDKVTPARAAVVGLTVAQSAAMEYYERIVEELFARTSTLVERLEKRGTVPLSTRPLHRFIGEAIGTRSEVLSVLHLLDKPDATWEDPALDHIYNDLRAQFDLQDRYEALESKLHSVQEALELVLDVARDRRLVLLEAAIVLLIVVEIALTLAGSHS